MKPNGPEQDSQYSLANVTYAWEKRSC